VTHDDRFGDDPLRLRPTRLARPDYSGGAEARLVCRVAVRCGGAPQLFSGARATSRRVTACVPPGCGAPFCGPAACRRSASVAAPRGCRFGWRGCRWGVGAQGPLGAPLGGFALELSLLGRDRGDLRCATLGGSGALVRRFHRYRHIVLGCHWGPSRSSLRSTRKQADENASRGQTDRGVSPGRWGNAFRSTTPAPQSKPVAHASRLVAHIAPLVAFGLGVRILAAGPARITTLLRLHAICAMSLKVFPGSGCDLRALADVQEPLIAIKLATV